MDDSKEVPGEENVVTADQPSVENAPPDEAAAQPSDEGQAADPEASDSPVTDEAIAEDEPAVQAEEAPMADRELAPEAGEARVEMLDDTGEQGEKPVEEQADAGAQEPQAVSEGPAEATEETPTVESVIEAILFATDEPLPESKLAGIVETTAKQVRESIESLNARYEANHNAFRIEQIAGGYQMLTQPIYNSWLKKMLRVRSDNKLSPAAMETLAIIAYKQPIIRADIEAIRGVAVGEVIRSLMYKGLVKIAGRAEILGRPMLYGTTKKFLEIFGLNSLKDLPKAEDLKNPDRG